MSTPQGTSSLPHRTALALVVLLAMLARLDLVAEAQGERPRVGVVLSGGGARGAAHVGVLQVLEELRVPVDAIAGTSMGAIVGGLYASGLTAEEIAAELSEVDWGLAFDDATPRELVPFRRKQDDQRFKIDLELGFRPWELVLPKGLLQGQKLGLILETLTLHVAGVEDFDRLAIPFRAVAADLATGEAVVMDGGELATAMRASMSVPGVFAPVRRDGRTLVDGGIAKNLPVDVVRELGVDVVIAIDITSPLLDEEAIASAFGVTGQMISILMQENALRQKALLGERDVLIEPELGGVGSTDFHRAAEAIQAGAEAARAAGEVLAALALGEGEYDAWRAARSSVPRALPRIRAVVVENDSKLADEAVRAHVSSREGRPLDPAALREDIARIYGYDAFEQVDFALRPVGEGEADLLIRAHEKSWGPSYLQFSLDVEQDFEGSDAFGVGVSDLWYPINRYGAEWRNELQVGSDSRLFSELYHPLDVLGRWFVAPSVSYERTDVGLFLQGQRVAVFDVAQFEYSLSVGRQLSNWGEARVGVAYAHGDVELSTGDPALAGSRRFEDGSAFLRFTYDSLDDSSFPRRGRFGTLSYELSREALGADANNETLALLLGHAGTHGPDTLVGSVAFSTNVGGSAAVQDQFALGGFLNLSGFSRGELFGNHAGLARLIYYRELGYQEGVPFDVPFFAGLSTELGGVFQDREDVTGRNALWAGSAFLAADTFFGPLFLGYGVAEGGERALYLFVGGF